MQKMNFLNSCQPDPFIANLLCRSWYADSYEGHIIAFRPDGSGEIISRAEFNTWMAAYIEWKLIDSSNIDETISDTAYQSSESFINRLWGSSTKTIFNATIEMTITKRRMPDIDGEDLTGRTINDYLLLDEAFLPKQYTIRVDQGTFLTQSDPAGCSLRYGLRLSFNPSPYPALQLWKPIPGTYAVHDMKQFELVDFCAQEVKDVECGNQCLLM